MSVSITPIFVADKTRNSYSHSDLQEQAMSEPCTSLLQEIVGLQDKSKTAYRFNWHLDNPPKQPTQTVECEATGICATYQPSQTK